MNSSEHSPIMALPYEVLVKIFCYLEDEDLLKSTQFVCTQWRDLSHDLKVWKLRKYMASQTNEGLIKFLRTMPSLQHLVLTNPVPDSVLNCIPEQCRQLRIFRCILVVAPLCDFYVKLRSYCQRLEQLAVSITEDNILEEIGKFANLKHLEVDALKPLLWKPIADGCPSLVSLDLEEARIQPAEFAYLLEKKKHQLTALHCLSCSQVKECPLPYITLCEKLEELHLSGVFKCTTRHKVCLPLLRSMKTITILSLSVYFYTAGENAGQNEVLKLFKNKGMCQLKEIDLRDCNGEVLCTILQNCPLLKKLSYGCMDSLVESSLCHLEALPFLESLDLFGTRLSGNVWQYLQNCARLSTLDFTCCFKERCLESKQTLPELKNLRNLKLGDCNLIEFPFNEVLLKFPKLEFLGLSDSQLSDIETVRSLSRQKRQLKVNLKQTHEDSPTTLNLYIGDLSYRRLALNLANPEF